MIQQATTPQNPNILGSFRALKRAAKRALEIGIQTGTPVYVIEKGRIVDIAKRQRRKQASR